MPFRLTNALVTFQASIDDFLRPYIDDFTVCYLDDILLCSANKEKHEEHIQIVLQRLQELGLYRKAEKCQFRVRDVGFLRLVINSEGIGMQSDRIPTIEDWPTPESVQDVQVLLGFTNFYWRFIRNYAKVTAPISILLRTPGSWKCEWTRDAELPFRKLKKAFTKAPILQHFNSQKPIILQTDPSGFAIAVIHNQYDGLGILRAVNFYSRKCSLAKQNYDMYDQELFAIVETMNQWRHHLEGTNHKVLIQCDHKNLEYFQTSKVLSRRQARWADILSSYDFDIEPLEGKKHPAARPSRRRDYELGYERPTARLLATLAATTVEQYDDLLQEIKAAQAIDVLAADMKHRILGTPIIDIPHLQRIDESQEESTNEWKLTAGVFIYERRIYVPKDDLLRNKVISSFHDNPESGHFGALKTTELVSRDFHRPAMDATV
jgi:hypothetical protein